jgi:hypothetical protein
MNKRLFIVHGWMGSAAEPLMVWLGGEGRRLGFETTVVEMPNPTVPTVDASVKAVTGAIAGVRAVGGDAGKATTDAVTGAIEAAGEISETTLKEVKEALSEGVDGAKEVIHKI